MKICIYFVLVFGLLSEAPGAEIIRFATLAPEGSSWMVTMRAMDEELRTATSGEVGFKFYPNMSMGDETDVIRKIRLGQISGAGFTGFGLGEILPEVRVLEAPYIFETTEEIDYALSELTPYFRQKFSERGFHLLGWAEVGWIYFMAQKPVAKPKDLEGLKVWMWEGDPLARMFYQELGKTPVTLSVTDVRLSLQTGMIDAVYGSPLATLVLQWFPKLKYISDIPFTNAVGAVMIDRKAFERLTLDQQNLLSSIADKHLKKLNDQSRADNRNAYERLLKEGLQKVPSTAEERAEMMTIGNRVQEKLAGELYPAELLKNLRDLVKESRSKKKSSPSK
jgi:TRAP-type C4-dicarboxylate transport system substrate-binding protein